MLLFSVCSIFCSYYVFVCTSFFSVCFVCLLYFLIIFNLHFLFFLILYVLFCTFCFFLFYSFPSHPYSVLSLSAHSFIFYLHCGYIFKSSIFYFPFSYPCLLSSSPLCSISIQSVLFLLFFIFRVLYLYLSSVLASAFFNYPFCFIIRAI